MPDFDFDRAIYGVRNDPASAHYYECDAYDNEDAECLGCPDGIHYVRAALKERRERAADCAVEAEIEERREERC